jgi:hypothetical protein
MLARALDSRACRGIGWGYVVYWVLVSGLLVFVLAEEVRASFASPAGERIRLYGAALMFWAVTAPTLACAIAGWWTLGIAAWRRVARSRRAVWPRRGP